MRPAHIDGVAFGCYALSGDFRAFVRRCIDLAQEQGVGKVLKWNSMRVDQGKTGQMLKAVETLPASKSDAADDPAFLAYMTDRDIVVSHNYHPDAHETGICEISIGWAGSKDSDAKEIDRFGAFCIAFAAGLMRDFDVYSAKLNVEPGGECLPNVPLVQGWTHICIASDASVKAKYDAPDVFWNAGWKVIDEHQGKRLLARHPEVIGGTDYLRNILHHQWAMARAAKPKLTTYEEPIVLPREDAVFHAGDKRIHSVGYDEARKLLEYSCVLERDQHIQGWEIYALRKMIVDGKSSEGWPVKTVRIVFMEAWMAREEKRPLLDIGCEVHYYGDDGDLKEFKA